MKSVLVCGASYMELSIKANRLPQVGEDLSDGVGTYYAPSGSDSTLAVALAKLGVKSTFITKLGADLHGRYLFDYYRTVGVDTSFMKVDRDYGTGLVVRIRTPEGVRTMTEPGANQNLTPDNLGEVFKEPKDALAMGFSLPFSTVLAAAKGAAAAGVPIYLSATGLTPDMKTDILPKAEFLVAGEEETARLSGTRPTGHTEALQAALTLYKRVPCKYVILHMAGRGLFLYDGRHYRLISPVGNARPKGSRGKADDVFFAAFVSAMAQGSAPDTAVSYAAGAEAYVLFGEGDDLYPTDEDIRATVRRYQ